MRESVFQFIFRIWQKKLQFRQMISDSSNNSRYWNSVHNGQATKGERKKKKKKIQISTRKNANELNIVNLQLIYECNYCFFFNISLHCKSSVNVFVRWISLIHTWRMRTSLLLLLLPFCLRISSFFFLFCSFRIKCHSIGIGAHSFLSI